MDRYAGADIQGLLARNPYPGRGIMLGMAGERAVYAYFITARSANSKNRVITMTGNTASTRPRELSKVEDARFTMYNIATRSADGRYIVTNGDQTDTVADGLNAGKSFTDALKARRFEEDFPHMTPRISALLDVRGGFSYQMSILKSGDADGRVCDRYTFEYEGASGIGHYISTYSGDGAVLPSYVGEPAVFDMPNLPLTEFAHMVWSALPDEKRVAMLACSIDIEKGSAEYRVINQYPRETARNI